MHEKVLRQFGVVAQSPQNRSEGQVLIPRQFNHAIEEGGLSLVLGSQKWRRL